MSDSLQNPVFTIGFRGAAQAGKTTAALAIQNHYESTYLRSISDYLWELSAVIFAWDPTSLNQSKEVEHSLTRRQRAELKWECRGRLALLRGHIPIDIYQCLSEWILIFCSSIPKLSYRSVMQSMGKAIRTVNPSYLIERVKLDASQSTARIKINHSVRFPDELASCQYVIEIIRPDGPELSEQARGAMTEHALDGCASSYTIHNDGTLEEFYAKVLSTTQLMLRGE